MEGGGPRIHPQMFEIALSKKIHLIIHLILTPTIVRGPTSATVHISECLFCRLWIGAISVCTQSITPKYLLKVLLFCYRKMKQIECTARTKTLPAVIHPCYAFPAAKWPPSKVYYLKTVHMQEQCCVKNLCSCSAIKRLAHSFLFISEKSDLNF